MNEIVNTRDQLLAARAAGLPDIAINPHYWQATRSWPRGGWHIYRPDYNLNPKQKNRYSDEYGVRVYGATAHKEERPALLVAAKEWAGKRYRIKKWKRNCMGAYVDARVQERFPLRAERLRKLRLKKIEKKAAAEVGT